MANWAWPEIIDEDSARSAAHTAGGWAAAVAGLTTLLAIISIFSSVSLLGINAYSLVDAALFGVVAWRVWCGSRGWAIAGLALYGLEVVYAVVTHPPGVGILTIIVLLALINGVRGTFALHKYTQMNRQQQAMSAAQAAGAQSYQPSMPTTAVPPPPPPPPEPPK
jgi:hypothetical protein